jgi:outer membrane immunogenic protein
MTVVQRLGVPCVKQQGSPEMKRLILAFVAAVPLFATGAAAQRAPAYEPAWTGFYVGAGIGSGAVVHDLSVGIPGLNVLGFDGIGGEGFFGTVIVGYDRKLTSNIVAGVFTDYDFSNISSDVSLLGGLFSASLEHKYSWSAGGRLGVLTSPSTLWYGTAGYTQAEFDLTSSIGSLDLPKFKGYFLGGGVESQLVQGWSLRAEYRYTQFQSETVASIGPINIDVEPSMHTGRVALTYKWGREEVLAAPMK